MLENLYPALVTKIPIIPRGVATDISSTESLCVREVPEKYAELVKNDTMAKSEPRKICRFLCFNDQILYCFATCGMHKETGFSK